MKASERRRRKGGNTGNCFRYPYVRWAPPIFCRATIIQRRELKIPNRAHQDCGACVGNDKGTGMSDAHTRNYVKIVVRSSWDGRCRANPRASGASNPSLQAERRPLHLAPNSGGSARKSDRTSRLRSRRGCPRRSDIGRPAVIELVDHFGFVERYVSSRPAGAAALTKSR